MQEPGSAPRQRRVSVALAVVLLAISALTLPMVSFNVVAASAHPGTGPASDWGAVAHQSGQSHVGVVLDGIASVFVVAPPLVGGPSQTDEFGMPVGPSPAGAPSAVIIVGNLTSFHGTFNTRDMSFGPEASALAQGFGTSMQWLPNGAMLRAGIIGESFLVPSSSAVSAVTAALPKIWWDFFQRRSKFEIYVEMLELMKRGPMTPFEVAFYARLNHKRTKEYAELLTEAGYLQPVMEDGRTLYALTGGGLRFLDQVQALLVGPGILLARPEYQRDF